MKKLLSLLIATNAYAQCQCDCPCPSPSPSPTATPSPTPAPGDAACLRIVRTGWLYKPESEDTRDNREGKPMTLFESKVRVNGDAIRVLDIHGKRICNFIRFTSEGAEVKRYYAGKPGTNYCNTTPKELAAKAYAANGDGTTTIYIRLSETDGEKRCIRVPDPTQRRDNR